MTQITDIGYAPEHGLRGEGDLFLPTSQQGAPVALVIHGGGWNAMDRRSFEPAVRTLVMAGFATFNVNYRLLDTAPWPACGDDCLRAARFALAGAHPGFADVATDTLLVVGGSAGAHLALMTGLRLDPGSVSGIVSIAGPVHMDFLRRRASTRSSFFGKELADVSEAEIGAASPVSYVASDSPPLLCIHSTTDELVPIDHSRRIVADYRCSGAQAELFEFEGKDTNHGIWEPHGQSTAVEDREFVPSVHRALTAFATKLAATD